VHTLTLSMLDFQGPRVAPTGSYMTAGHYVIAWLERPHRDFLHASKWFAKGRQKNYAPWRIWSEHDRNDGGAVNFITAGGIFLQSLVFGYAGLRFNDHGMSMDPLLPPNVTAMKLRGLNYASTEIDVEVDSQGMRAFKRSDSHSTSNYNGKIISVYRAPDGVYWLT
jgi:hypothetical protein